MSDELKILGQTVNEPITKDQLETFPAPRDVENVSLYSDEVTSLCPKTKQPDFYEIEINYMPRDKCLESKSLKLYLWQFRQTGQFIEDLTNKIADEIFEVLNPLGLKVRMKMKPRGGISIVATAVRQSEEMERRQQLDLSPEGILGMIIGGGIPGVGMDDVPKA